ncbi:MAG: two-component system, response regulator YesN [Clostridiales bacterium]|nr:two-component system, response regulator YesN [Clostridiales bacterium]
MKKIVVAEDGRIIREGICAMVRRSGVPIEEIIECKNGLEALETIKREKIDLLITDIRMPKMDGITLVKELQKNAYVPKIIVISGYDDFSFVVDSLRCGVREYLLKPIKREEVNAILERLEEEIKKEVLERGNKRASFYGQMRTLLASSSLTNTELDEMEGSFLFGNAPFCVICTNHSLVEKCTGEDILFFPDIEGSNVIVCRENQRKEVYPEGGVQYIGISREYQGCRSVRTAFLEAKKQRVAAFCMQQEQPEDVSYQISLSELESMVQRIGTLRNKENEEFIDSVAEKVKQGKMDGLRFQEMICQIVSRVKDFYGRVLTDEGIYIDNLCHMLTFEHIDQYVEEIKRIFSLISSKALSESDDYHNRMKLEEAISYIQKNFEKNINMAMVSNYVSMNYTVFSIEFKEYTGENFVTYLRNIRIREAKRLLSQSNMKIGDICSNIGYDNEKHFMKTFKAIVGVTPGEYRKNVRMGCE